MHQFKCRTQNIKAPFGIKVFLKYSENTSVSTNTEVPNTLWCLDPMNTVDWKSILQNCIFCLIENFSPCLFFFKKNEVFSKTAVFLA
jgi:hypothetical protein